VWAVGIVSEPKQSVINGKPIAALSMEVLLSVGVAPYVRIDVALGNNGKRGEREGKARESATNGRV
jgi:hypothetical protein